VDGLAGPLVLQVLLEQGGKGPLAAQLRLQ
jgi:hypothetical protein